MTWYPDPNVVVVEAVDDVFRVGDVYQRGDFASWLVEGMVPVGLHVRTASTNPMQETEDWVVAEAEANDAGHARVVRGEDGEVVTPDEFRCPPARNGTRARVLLAILAYIDEHDDLPTVEAIAGRLDVARPTVRYHYRIMLDGGLFMHSWRGLSYPTAAGRRIAERWGKGEVV